MEIKGLRLCSLAHVLNSSSDWYTELLSLAAFCCYCLVFPFFNLPFPYVRHFFFFYLRVCSDMFVHTLPWSLSVAAIIRSWVSTPTSISSYSSSTVSYSSTPIVAIRRRCLTQPITLHKSSLTQWLSTASRPSGNVPYLLWIMLIIHRDIHHAFWSISIRNQCVLKLHLTSWSLLRQLTDHQRHNRSVGRGEERRKHTMHRLPQQLQLGFEIPHYLVTSFLCCTELQILCTQMHTHTLLQVHTRCLHTLAPYASIVVYPKRSLQRFVGGRVCVSLEVYQRQKETPKFYFLSLFIVQTL